MLLDVALGVLALLLALWGLLSGIVKTLLRLAAVALAAMASAPLGRIVAAPIRNATDLPLTLSYGLGRTLAGLLLVASLGVAAAQGGQLWGKTRGGLTTRWNSLLGAAGGFALGIVLALAVGWVLQTWNASFGETMPAALREGVEHSMTAQAATSLVPVRQHAVTDMLTLVETVRDQPELVRLIADDPAVRRFMDIPTVKAAVDDPEVQALARDRAWGTLLRNPKVRAAADDPAVSKAIGEADLLDVLRRRIQAVRAAVLLRALVRADPKRAESDRRVQDLLALDPVKKALADEGLCAALREAKWDEAVKHPLLEAAASDRTLGQAASDAGFVRSVEALAPAATK